jgi:lipopolysaccharide transport system permease protein
MSLLSLAANGRACRELLGLAVRYRQLTWEMTRREIKDRYAGQVLGSLWAFAHPLLIMGVFVFLYAYVMRVEVPGDLPLDYTAYLLAGVIPWMACAEVMGKGVVALTSSSNLVKQVVFPLEVLPLKGVLAALFTQLVSMGLLTAYILLRFHMLPWSFALLPLLLVLQGAFLLGVSCILAAVGPYFRDLKDFVQVYTLIGVYLAPVVYLPAMVPAIFRPLLYLNPFSYLIWCYQDACFFGRFQHPKAWVAMCLLSLVTVVLGYRVFRSLKPMLGNVL